MTQDQRRKLDDLKKCLDSGDLEGFELDFVRSNFRRPDSYELSPKQLDALDQIWGKHCGPDDGHDDDEDDGELVDWRDPNFV